MATAPLTALKRAATKATVLCAVAFGFHASPAAALTLNELRIEVRNLALDNGASLRHSTSAVDSLINEGQRVAAIETKAVETSTRIVLSAGTTFYSMPTDFLQIRQVIDVGEDWTLMQELSPEAVAERVGLESAGHPQYYVMDFALRGDIGFAPFPGVAADTTTVDVWYYAQPAELLVSTAVPFNAAVELAPYHYGLAYFAASHLALIDGRPDLAIWYERKFFAVIDRMKREARNRPTYRPQASGLPR